MIGGRPLYLMRAGFKPLVALSLAELGELIECAHEAGDRVELLHVYHHGESTLGRGELERLIRLLARC